MAIVVLLFSFSPDSALGQELAERRFADTSSPRETLRSFIEAGNQIFEIIQQENFIDNESGDHIPAVSRFLDCLDVSALPAFARSERSGEVAVCLKEIIDRFEIPPWDEIPGIEQAQPEDGRQPVLQWRIPGTRLTIARVEEGPQKHEFLFTTGTVDRAVQYFQSVESIPYRTTGPPTTEGFYKWYTSAPGKRSVGQIVNRLPDGLRFGRTFGLANWKWPGLLIVLVLAVTSMVFLYRVHFTYAPRWRHRPVIYILTITLPILAAYIPLLFVDVIDNYLTIRGTGLYILSFCGNVVAILASVVVVFGLCNRLAEAIIASPKINPMGLNAQLIRISAKLLSVAGSAIVFLIGGQYLGIPVATLLASAGIGGVALALGAQDTLKTLFGTIMLMGDKPFRVGERIIVKGYDGNVEDIGLRSTRVRLLNGNQVTIPNDDLARSDIENVGRRERIRRVAEIHVPLDTPLHQLEQAVFLIRELLQNHEGMNAEYPPRVYLKEFEPTAFVVRLMYWYQPANYWDFMAFSDKVNFGIIRALEDNGISFSLPTRMTHTSIDSEPAPLQIQVRQSDSDSPQKSDGESGRNQ